MQTMPWQVNKVSRGWFTTVPLKVGGAACERRLHSRLPPNRRTCSFVNAVAPEHPKLSPAR